MWLFGLMKSPTPQLLLVLCCKKWTSVLRAFLAPPLFCRSKSVPCPHASGPFLMRSSWCCSTCSPAAGLQAGAIAGVVRTPPCCKARWYGRQLFGLGESQERRRRELHCVLMDEKLRISRCPGSPSGTSSAGLVREMALCRRCCRLKEMFSVPCTMQACIRWCGTRWFTGSVERFGQSVLHLCCVKSAAFSSPSRWWCWSWWMKLSVV